MEKKSARARLPLWFLGGLCLGILGLFLSGCVATARLSQRREAYQAVLAKVGRSQGEYNARALLLKGLLQRSKTPLAAPYPDLVARLRVLAGDLDVLKRGGEADLVFEGDFDAFVRGQPPVLTKRSPAWARYQALDGRFQGIAVGLGDLRRAFVSDRKAFDAVAESHKVAHLDPAALGVALDALNTELRLGLKRMEVRVRADQAAVDFQKGSGGPADLLSNERNVLEKMQTHIFRSGELVQHALFLSDKVRALGTPGGFWAGPGLPDDGSDWAKLAVLRRAFLHRRAEFKGLAQAFAALELSVSSSVPVQ
ncbi:MAG: hypothetical protein ACREKE_09815 [bacterium]